MDNSTFILAVALFVPLFIYGLIVFGGGAIEGGGLAAITIIFAIYYVFLIGHIFYTRNKLETETVSVKDILKKEYDSKDNDKDDIRKLINKNLPDNIEAGDITITDTSNGNKHLKVIFYYEDSFMRPSYVMELNLN